MLNFEVYKSFEILLYMKTDLVLIWLVEWVFFQKFLTQKCTVHIVWLKHFDITFPIISKHWLSYGKPLQCLWTWYMICHYDKRRLVHFLCSFLSPTWLSCSRYLYHYISICLSIQLINTSVCPCWTINKSIDDLTHVFWWIACCTQ